MSRAGLVKCVVWDLDDTLWRGTVAEGDEPLVGDATRAVIAELDRRGILQSVASRNDPAMGEVALRRVGLADYFVHPQIGWGEKTAAIAVIADALGIGLDSVVFVDDSPFERAAMAHEHVEVRCIAPDELAQLLADEVFSPHLDGDHSERRRFHQADGVRRAAETSFSGSKVAFLQSLDLRMTIRPLEETDIDRAVELIDRTNQLNATGTSLSSAELRTLRWSAGHLVLVCELADDFGDYGVVGLAVLAVASTRWDLMMFLMSCRVLARNAGGALLSWLMRKAKECDATLWARFVKTARNRPLWITFKLNGFVADDDGDGCRTLRNDLSRPITPIDYISIVDAPAVELLRMRVLGRESDSATLG
jgi:FkbH-like protein